MPMNVMDLLAAVDPALRTMCTCSDEEYAQLLGEVSQGSLPRNVEAAHDEPL
jgi:hypothetical protein